MVILHSYIFIDCEALANKEDNRLGSIISSVCLPVHSSAYLLVSVSVCVFV